MWGKKGADRLKSQRNERTPGLSSVDQIVRHKTATLTGGPSLSSGESSTKQTVRLEVRCADVPLSR